MSSSRSPVSPVDSNSLASNPLMNRKDDVLQASKDVFLEYVGASPWR